MRTDNVKWKVGTVERLLKRFGASETCDIGTKRDSQKGFSLYISPRFTFPHSLETKRGGLIEYMLSALVDTGIRRE